MTEDVSINFWYLPDQGKQSKPLIVEFAFDYTGKKASNNSKGSNGKMLLLEQFPISFVRFVDNLFKDVQKGKIVDLDATKTKTEFAYHYKPQ